MRLTAVGVVVAVAVPTDNIADAAVAGDGWKRCPAPTAQDSPSFARTLRTSGVCVCVWALSACYLHLWITPPRSAQWVFKQ